MVEALAEGLRASPPGLGAIPTDLAGTFVETARLVTLVLTIGVSLAAPALVALVAADAGLAVIARSAPQLPVYFVGMPLRAWLGLAALLVALAWITPELVRLFGTFVDATRAVF
jgi:flagellar biosynthetic protein FliR